MKNLLQKAIADVNSSDIFEQVTNKQPPVAKKDNIKGLTTFQELNSNIWWRKINENLSSWSNKDFAMYLLNLYKEKYKKPSSLHPVHIVSRIGDVRETVRSSLGFCDNIVLKDYITYFCDIWLDHYHIHKSLDYWIRPMRDQKPINEFAKHYTYGKSLAPVVNTSKNTAIFELHDIKQSYMLGVDSLLLQFGLIIAFNYLVEQESYSIESASEVIAKSSLRLYNRKSLQRVIYATENIESYPSDFYDMKLIDQKLVELNCLHFRSLNINIIDKVNDWVFRRKN